MKFLILFLLSGCVSTIEAEYKVAHKPVYSLGDCVVVFDPESGYYRDQDIVRIEGISEEKYYYRWWLPMAQTWASSPNSGIGKFSTFENMTFKTTCPTPKKK